MLLFECFSNGISQESFWYSDATRWTSIITECIYLSCYSNQLKIRCLPYNTYTKYLLPTVSRRNLKIKIFECNAFILFSCIIHLNYSSLYINILAKYPVWYTWDEHVHYQLPPTGSRYLPICVAWRMLSHIDGSVVHASSWNVFNTILCFSESDRAKEGDGFDQVGNNPCNSEFLLIN